MTNTLAYYDTELMTTAKRFSVKAPFFKIILFCDIFKDTLKVYWLTGHVKLKLRQKNHFFSLPFRFLLSLSFSPLVFHGSYLIVAFETVY